jgi:hypothetical protein
VICCSNFSSEVFTGATSSPMACWRFSSSPRHRLLGFQRGTGEFEEALVVLRQGIGRDRLEGVGETGTGGFERGLAFGEQGTFAFELALQRGAPYRQRRLFIAQRGEFGFALRQRLARLPDPRRENHGDQAAAEQQADDE